MQIKPRDNGMFKFFNIDQSRYPWIGTMRYQSNVFEMQFNLTFQKDGSSDKTMCSGIGQDCLSHFILEGEVSNDNSITLEKKINNDKSHNNKMKLVGKIDLVSKKISGKAFQISTLLRNRFGYEIDFEFKINRDRFKALLNQKDRLMDLLKGMSCPVCL